MMRQTAGGIDQTERVYAFFNKNWLGWITGFLGILALLTGCALEPETITIGKSRSQAKQDLAALKAEQPAPAGEMTLYEAMARAIKFNRTRRVQLMETALAARQLELSHFDMLPSLAVSAGYEGREPQQASSSESVETGQISLEPSTSQDKDRAVGNAAFTWNVLDFGVSYFRASQESDRHLIALEKERKAVQILLRDVRKAWWEALSAQRLLKKVDPLMNKVSKALADSRKIEHARLQRPLEALNYQRSMLKILQTLELLRKELVESRTRLASLIGLTHAHGFQIAEPSSDQQTMPQKLWDAAAMEQAALIMRPELMQVRYEARISDKDVHAALLGILPNLNLNAGWNWDSNSYLVDNTWLDYGTAISWNLLNVFRGKQAMAAANAKQNLVYEQRMAMSMAVLMQVHLAKANYVQSQRSFALANDYLDVQGRILQQIQISAGRLEGEQAFIREELNHLVAEVRRDNAHARLQDSYGRILVSMGVDLVPVGVDDVTVEDLAAGIETNVQRWQQRDLITFLGLGVVEKTAASLETRPEEKERDQADKKDLTPAQDISETGAAQVLPAASSDPETAPSTVAEQDTPGKSGKAAGTEEKANLKATPQPVAAKVEKEDSPPMEVASLPEAQMTPTLDPAASERGDEDTAQKSAAESKILAQPGPPGILRGIHVRIRQQPSLEAPILAESETPNETVRVVGQQTDWYQVVYRDLFGWVHRTLVRIQNAARQTWPSDGKGIVTGSRVNIRSQPSLDSHILRTTKDPGEPVQVVGRTGNWIEISEGPVSGWIHHSLVQTGNSAANPWQPGKTVMVTGERVNVRRRPSLDADIVHTTKASGETFEVVGHQGRWIEIAREAIAGWMHSAYLKEMSE